LSILEKWTVGAAAGEQGEAGWTGLFLCAARGADFRDSSQNWNQYCQTRTMAAPEIDSKP